MNFKLIIPLAALVLASCVSQEQRLEKENGRLVSLLRDCGYSVTEFKRKDPPYANYAYWELKGEGVEALIPQKQPSTVVYLGPYTMKNGDTLYTIITHGINDFPTKNLVTAVGDLNDVVAYVFAGSVYSVPSRLATFENDGNGSTINNCRLP